MKKWLMTAALSALTFSACAQESPHAETVHTGFQSPTAIVSDAGALYVSDWSANQIVRIAADRSRHVVSDAAAAPAGLALNKAGKLYAASYADNYYRAD